MLLLIQIAGIIQVLLAFVHFIFPRHFEWKKDLGTITLINRQLMYVHTFFIALVVLMMGVLCLFAATEIMNTKLGKIISFGLFLFWATRLVFQFFVYSPVLWKGKKFETIVHVIFSIIWIYLTAIFLLAFNLPQ
jgi:hypothetical protein